MAKENAKVHKMLSPEEKTILGNIASLAKELMMDDSGDMMDGDSMMKAKNPMMMKAEAPMIGDDEEDMMDPVMKADMGPTANADDKAENRVKDGTDITEGNYSEVGKALISMLSGMKVQKSAPVQRSAPQQNDVLVMKALTEITSVMKSISDRQEQNDLAMANILDGLGVTKQLETVQKSVDTNRPIQNLDSNMVLKSIVDMIAKNSNDQNPDRQHPFNVRKNSRSDLAAALPAILSRN